MLEVKNVSKQYRGEDKLLFDAVSDVSLSMEDHCIYALVGESGCGKSTVINMIPRFYDATKGEVLVDGVNVKEYTQKALRNKKSEAKRS